MRLTVCYIVQCLHKDFFTPTFCTGGKGGGRGEAPATCSPVFFVNSRLLLFWPTSLGAVCIRTVSTLFSGQYIPRLRARSKQYAIQHVRLREVRHFYNLGTVQTDQHDLLIDHLLESLACRCEKVVQGLPYRADPKPRKQTITVDLRS